MIRKLLFTAVLLAGAAHAEPHRGPDGPGPRGPGGPPPIASPEALATVPGLDGAQQTEVRRILIQRRDAHDALRMKEDAERNALMTRYRGEHERIDDDSSARLRKLLGEDGYRNLAAWLMPPRPEHGPGHPPAPPPPGRPPVAGSDPGAAAPLVPDPDDDTPQPPRVP